MTPVDLEPDELFRTRMAQRRRRIGLKQSDLAREATRMGVPLSQAAISNIESGKTEHVKLRDALAIAAVLDVPLEQLYQTPLDWDEEFDLVSGGLSESHAWLRVWKDRRTQTKESQ